MKRGRGGRIGIDEVNAFDERKSSSGSDGWEDCAGFQEGDGGVGVVGDGSCQGVVASECFLLLMRMLGVEMAPQVRWM